MNLQEIKVGQSWEHMKNIILKFLIIAAAILLGSFTISLGLYGLGLISIWVINNAHPVFIDTFFISILIGFTVSFVKIMDYFLN